MFISPGLDRLQVSYRFLVSVLRFAIVSALLLVSSGLNAQAQSLSVSLSAPPTAYVDEVILIDARQSVGVSKFPQLDGRPSVIIDFGDGFSANLLASGHAYRVPGTYTITLTGKDSGGGSATTQRTIVVSSIPPATGLNIRLVSDTGDPVLNAANLQTAINAAAASNMTSEQEIVLPAGAVFAGEIILPTPVGDKYITIRSSSLSSLPAGNRVGPGHGNLMPVFTAPSSTSSVHAALETIAPAPVNPPHHYRIQGIHLKKDDETRRTASLMNIGTDGSVGISRLPHHFIVDRCWFDGGASDTSEVMNGLRIYGNSVSVVDSYAGEFRLIGAGVDTAAITPVTGQGPLAFVNNTMIATSENFNIAGGAAERGTATISNATTTSCTLSNVINLEIDQNIALPVGGSYSALNSTIIRSISGNNVTFDAIASAPDNGGTAEWIPQPSFIEFRRNYLYKPLKWWPSHPTWNGINYQIKNLWETKFSRYVVVDGNVMENSWIAAQGYAIAISPRNRTGGESYAAVVREMQWSNNIIKNAGSGINLASDDYGTWSTQGTTDITFRNNLFQNVGRNFDATGAAHMLINMQNSNVRLKRIFLIHNTHDNGMPLNEYEMITDFGDNGGADESMWINNVHQHGGYGFRSNFTVVDSAANISRFLPSAGGTNWNRNLIVNSGGAIYPSTGIYTTGSWTAQFQNYAAGDFTLVAGNPGKGAATDGTDIGVDMPQMNWSTLGAVSGIWDGSVPAPTPTPTPSPTPTPPPGGSQLGASVLRATRDGQTLSNQLGSSGGTSAPGASSALAVAAAETAALQLFITQIQTALVHFNVERQNFPAAVRIEVALGAALQSAVQAHASSVAGDLPGVRTHLRQAISQLELSGVLIIHGNVNNPIDVASYVVRQHYVDFLDREPEQSGYDFWVNEFSACGNDARCFEDRRIHVSAAFFLSIEFRQTGYFVHRLYRSSYGRLPRFAELMPDNLAVGHGVIVGTPGWEARLAANKQAFLDAWVQRADFTAHYSGLSNAQYVDALIVNLRVPIDPVERNSLVEDLAKGSSRASVLGRLAQNENFSNAELNSAFVLMQYFGYLRRDPDSAGFNFWLNKLNQFNGNYQNADMVKAFLASQEYRRRFGL